MVLGRNDQGGNGIGAKRLGRKWYWGKTTREEMVLGRNDWGMGDETTRVENRGETTRGKTTRGKRLGTKCLVNLYSDLLMKIVIGK